MMRRIVLFVLALAVACTAMAEPALEITLKHGTPAEVQTRDQLRRLLATFDVSRWIYTRSIVIDEQAIPHSHPVLTLHTRHLRDDDLLLSTFVHEQLHWFLESQTDATAQAIADLRKMFPSVPMGGTVGAGDEQATYEHLLLCDLEQQADVRLIGELRTRQVIEFLATDHYTWVYQMVLSRGRDIGQVLMQRKLVPDAARN